MLLAAALNEVAAIIERYGVRGGTPDIERVAEHARAACRFANVKPARGSRAAWTLANYVSDSARTLSLARTQDKRNPARDDMKILRKLKCFATGLHICIATDAVRPRGG
jgi:hypothetical protein